MNPANVPAWAYTYCEGGELRLSLSEGMDLDEIARATMHTLIQQSVYINGRFPHPPVLAQRAYEYALAMVLEKRAINATPASLKKVG